MTTEPDQEAPPVDASISHDPGAPDLDLNFPADRWKRAGATADEIESQRKAWAALPAPDQYALAARFRGVSDNVLAQLLAESRDGADLPLVPSDADVVDELHEATNLDIPPKRGTGSGVAAWVEYAHAAGVPVADGTTKAKIIEALRDAGVPTDDDEAAALAATASSVDAAAPEGPDDNLDTTTVVDNTTEAPVEDDDTSDDE